MKDISAIEAKNCVLSLLEEIENCVSNVPIDEKGALFNIRSALSHEWKRKDIDGFLRSLKLIKKDPINEWMRKTLEEAIELLDSRMNQPVHSEGVA